MKTILKNQQIIKKLSEKINFNQNKPLIIFIILPYIHNLWDPLEKNFFSMAGSMIYFFPDNEGKYKYLIQDFSNMNDMNNNMCKNLDLAKYVCLAQPKKTPLVYLSLNESFLNKRFTKNVFAIKAKKIINENNNKEFNKYLKKWGFNLTNKFLPFNLFFEASFNYGKLNINAFCDFVKLIDLTIFFCFFSKTTDFIEQKEKEDPSQVKHIKHITVDFLEKRFPEFEKLKDFFFENANFIREDDYEESYNQQKIVEKLFLINISFLQPEINNEFSFMKDPFK